MRAGLGDEGLEGLEGALGPSAVREKLFPSQPTAMAWLRPAAT